MELHRTLIAQLRITRPTVLVDRPKVIAHVAHMARKAHSAGIVFRPHFKTHQSARIGDWFRESDTAAATVSSLSMAGYFARHGWNDITVAFIANRLETDRINALASRIRLGLTVDHGDSITELRQHLTHPAHVFIKIDTGYGRTGIPWDDTGGVVSLARMIHDSELLDFAGLLTHAGHTYHARSRGHIRQIYDETLARLAHLKAILLDRGMPRCLLSVGDTPGCTVVEDFHGVDEIRPGNFAFYDLQQSRMGICSDDDIAVAVACPVVGIYPRRSEVVLYGGAVHLSKDTVENERGETVFGRLALCGRDGWEVIDPPVDLTALSQEHGKAKVPGRFLSRIRRGDVLLVLPVHSCLTVNLHREYLTLEGETLTSFNSTF